METELSRVTLLLDGEEVNQATSPTPGGAAPPILVQLPPSLTLELTVPFQSVRPSEIGVALGEGFGTGVGVGVGFGLPPLPHPLLTEMLALEFPPETCAPAVAAKLATSEK